MSCLITKALSELSKKGGAYSESINLSLYIMYPFVSLAARNAIVAIADVE